MDNHVLLGSFAIPREEGPNFQFIMTLMLDPRNPHMLSEFSTIMTVDEFRAIHAVIGRALQNKKRININDFKPFPPNE